MWGTLPTASPRFARVPAPGEPVKLRCWATKRSGCRIGAVTPSSPQPDSRARTWWDKFGWVLFLFAASRLLIVALTFYSRQTIARGPYVVVSVQNEHGGSLLDIMTQWDGFWYRFIASHGYGPPTPEIAAAFFPVYPLLVRALKFVVRDPQIASLLVSNGCLIAASLLLVRLLRLDYDELVCRRAVTFLMFNPVSFFLSAAYSESTYLLLSIAVLLAARQNKWLLASVCGGCLTATRAPGLMIGAPLLTEYFLQWRERGLALRQFVQAKLFWLALVPTGLAIHLSYFYIKRGDFFLPMHAQAGGWKKTLTWPWQTFLHPDNFSPSHIPLYQAIVGFSVVVAVAGFFLKLRPTYLVYVVAAILFYLAWGSLEGLPRYVSVLFPLHLVLALSSLRWAWLYEPLLAFSIGLLALCTILFANAYQMT
jgi:Mannosyltransferase (PIG-V)